VDLKYNLIATVNQKARKMIDDHYTEVSKIPTSESWYKYVDDIVNLVKFVKGNKKILVNGFPEDRFYFILRQCKNCLCLLQQPL
jgi:hypothetical protein